ncbi:hypothetical protein ACFL5V_03865 [Fibrobacterota bacterium]
MKRQDFNYVVSIMLLICVMITGMLGWIQARLELRQFVPHRYFAYATLCLAAVHVYLNFNRVWSFFKRKLRSD